MLQKRQIERAVSAFRRFVQGLNAGRPSTAADGLKSLRKYGLVAAPAGEYRAQQRAKRLRRRK